MSQSPYQKSDSLNDALVAQLKHEGITDQRILHAFATVPRDHFVPEALKPHSYENMPLPIGHGQTISQPFIVAYMLQAAHIRPEDTVLDIGTGSGYQAAILSQLAHKVYSIENIPLLAQQAHERLKALNCNNVICKVGDGAEGWPEVAPFDVIISAAAPLEIPSAWLNQLALHGCLVTPLGGPNSQTLVKVRQTPSGYEHEELVPVRFVPLT